MLKRLLPTCFGGSKPKPQGVNRQTVTNYNTHVGQVTLTWTRDKTGFSLATEIFLSCNENRKWRAFHFELKPSDVGKLGLRSFQVKTSPNDTASQVDIVWDFSRSRFQMRDDSQPIDGFYFGVALKGEVLITEGDLKHEACAQFVRAGNRGGIRNTYKVVTREEMVDLKGRSYGTKLHLGGKEREVRVTIGQNKYAPMTIEVNGEKLVDLKSLWSEDRGSKEFCSEEEVFRISWRLASWTPSLSKKKLRRMGPEREAGGVIPPKLIIAFSSTTRTETIRTPRDSSLYLRLISS